LLLPPPPRPTLFPYTTLFRSVDHASLSGYVAATGQPLVIADVYLLPEDVSYKQNRTFDEKFGYRTKSMLVLPMRTHKDDVIGVRSEERRVGKECRAGWVEE